MNVGDPHYDPLFPFGFGLKSESVRDLVTRSTSTAEFLLVPPFSVSLAVGLVSFCDAVLLLSAFPSMPVGGVVALQLLLLFRLPFLPDIVLFEGSLDLRMVVLKHRR
ncbi:hypothetical protein KIW84_030494, partial [Lathyrus oleraceus]